jgi:hypothetical protein
MYLNLIRVLQELTPHYDLGIKIKAMKSYTGIKNLIINFLEFFGMTTIVY